MQLEFWPGKEILIADLLYQAHLSSNEGEEVLEAAYMLSCLPISQDRPEKICEATTNDEVICMPMEVIMSGWPESKAYLLSQLTPYFRARMSCHHRMVWYLMVIV